MRLLPLVAGAIVPHAPLLLPELESPEVADAAATVRKAVASLDPGPAEAIAIVSPHARRTGIYHSGRGSLSSMSVPGIEVDLEVADDLVHEAAHEAGLPLLDDELDHGIVVPYRLASWTQPVVAIGIAENAAPEALTRVTDALRHIAGAAPVTVVASINTAAGLLPRAPLTHLPGAEDAEERLLDLLATDVGALATRALGIAQKGGSCATGPLTVLGRLFAEHAMEVLAHEAPVGVGYLVAQTA